MEMKGKQLNTIYFQRILLRIRLPAIKEEEKKFFQRLQITGLLGIGMMRKEFLKTIINIGIYLYTELA